MRTLEAPGAQLRARRRLLPSVTVLGAAVVALGLVAAVALHVAAGDRFPTPWLDEAHFMLPARSLALTGSLSVPELNAPSGIYWVPDGYYALLAVFLRVLPVTIPVARAVSFALTLGAAGCLVLTGRRLGAGLAEAGAVVGAWLIGAHLVVAGNIARMEAPVLFSAALALALAAYERWTLALVVAVLAPLVHPTGVAVTVVIVPLALLSPASLRPRRPIEWLALALAAGAWAVEVAHFAGHWDIASRHIEFQIVRKRGYRPLLRPDRAFVLPLGVAALLEVARRRIELGAQARVFAATVGLALSLAFVAAAGHEMWYGVYGTPTLVVLLALAALGVVARSRPAAARAAWLRPAVTGLVLLGTLAYGLHSWTEFYTEGLRWADAQRGAWAEFQRGALESLDELDQQLDRPAVVSVHPLSALTPALLARSWKHLSFVQPTQVTPTDGAVDALGRKVDYWLLTMDRQNAWVHLPLPQPPRWARAPVVVYGSTTDDYALYVWATPDPVPPDAAYGWA